MGGVPSGVLWSVEGTGGRRRGCEARWSVATDA